MEDLEKTLIDPKMGHFTAALDHKFVCIVFIIDSNDFSYILGDQWAPSLKQSDNS